MVLVTVLVSLWTTCRFALPSQRCRQRHINEQRTKCGHAGDVLPVDLLLCDLVVRKRGVVVGFQFMCPTPNKTDAPREPANIQHRIQLSRTNARTGVLRRALVCERASRGRR